MRPSQETSGAHAFRVRRGGAGAWGWGLLPWLGLWLGSALAQGAEPPTPAALDEGPAKLRPWADKAYAVRYFMKVEGPPLAGAVDLQPSPRVASLYLPLRGLAAKGKPESRIPESILVLGEDGAVQPVLVRPVKGGNEVEIAFPTRPGYRRYCLYAGAKQGFRGRASPRTFRPHAIRVRLRGQIAPGSFRPTPGHPLTLKRFQGLTPQTGRLGLTNVKAIDDPEPPKVFRTRRRTRYVGLYEAFLRAPLSGTYDFALSTHGAGVLLVDGVPRIAAGAGDPGRGPFALQGQAKLRAGIHRLTLYYAQAGQKNGVRLHWRPPFAQDFLRIPAQAFPRGLPAVVTKAERRGGAAQGFIHVELLGQFRTRMHRGLAQAREWVLLFAKGVPAGQPDGRILRFQAEGQAPQDVPASGGGAWMPAGALVTIRLLLSGGKDAPGQVVSRSVRFPSEANGGRDVVNLSGELLLKAAPQFLYPGETGQLHLETRLSPLPRIVSKKRLEKGPPLPEARPMGQYRLKWFVLGPDGKPLAGAAGPSDEKAREALVTPEASGRRKIRVPLPAAGLEGLARSGRARLAVALEIGGVPVETLTFRLLHARSPWPGALKARLDGLAFVPEGAEAGAAGKSAPQEARPERVLIVTPREHEADYRHFRPPGLRTMLSSGNQEMLFVGDPLVEALPGSQPEARIGLAADLARALPGKHWSALCLPGPHRGWFVFRLLAQTESFLRARGPKKLSGWVIVSIGGGDASRQTPLHHFERGLDVLVDRLRMAGAKRILMLGVLPEPGREKQGRRYQARWADLVRRHHLAQLDIFSRWTGESDWLKHFRLDPAGKKPTYGAVPNAEAIKELAAAIQEKLE